MTDDVTDSPGPAPERPVAASLVVDAAAGQRRAQQSLIDAEMRASRREILSVFRQRLGADVATLAAEDFLALADRQVVYSAVVIAAGRAADACCLQVSDPATGSLLVARSRGLSPQFLTSFETVDAAADPVCSVAVDTGDPVLVDDVSATPLLAGRSAPEVMIPDFAQALHAYPLLGERHGLLGLLWLYYRVRGRHSGQEKLAWAAAEALARCAEPRRPDPADPAHPRSPVDPATGVVTSPLPIVDGATDLIGQPTT